jgi:3-oxoacyl-[acyl-carrier protein] reductase
MSDRLIELGQNPQTRKIIQSLGLPIPLPQKLARAREPWEERPLQDQQVAVGAARPSPLSETLAQTLASAGAEPLVVGDSELLAAFHDAGEAYGRPPKHISNGAAEAVERVDAIVFDATGISSSFELGALYDMFHPWVKKLKRTGRAVVITRPHAAASNVAEAAAQRAVEGFVRSLAKEIGRKGSTANAIVVDADADGRLPGVLRFVLSRRSAFVSGQPIHVSARAAAPEEVPWTRVLDNKVALVTGAARGIGKATAKLLAGEGAHVVCLDRPADDGPVSQVAREVGGSVLLADVSSADAPKIIADGLRERGLDIVVHNAGVTRDKTLARMKREKWDQALDINLGAPVAITNVLLDEGVMRDQGRIVCLSSVAGIAGNMGQTNYAASKAGIIGFVEYLAPRLAERGITVNAIAPGFIETRLTKAIPTVIREVGRRLSALSQGGLPQDVGEAITFLASPGASGLTGSVLRVCGGAFIGA